MYCDLLNRNVALWCCCSHRSFWDWQCFFFKRCLFFPVKLSVYSLERRCSSLSFQNVIFLSNVYWGCMSVLHYKAGCTWVGGWVLHLYSCLFFVVAYLLMHSYVKLWFGLRTYILMLSLFAESYVSNNLKKSVSSWIDLHSFRIPGSGWDSLAFYPPLILMLGRGLLGFLTSSCFLLSMVTYSLLVRRRFLSTFCKPPYLSMVRMLKNNTFYFCFSVTTDGRPSVQNLVWNLGNVGYHFTWKACFHCFLWVDNWEQFLFTLWNRL